MCDCDFLPYYFIWSTEDTQQLYPNCLVGSSCVYKSVASDFFDEEMSSFVAVFSSVDFSVTF